VVNRGARDRFDLTAAATGRSWPFQWYVDVDGDGQKDAEDVTVVTDTDGNGVPDTGLLETDQQKSFLAVYAIPASEVTGNVSVTRTARSVAQPTASTATLSLTDSITVSTQACSGCTLKTYYLHSTPLGDTNITANMPMDLVAGTQGVLPNYDKDKNAHPGRTIAKGASGSGETDLTKYANWRFDAPNDMSFKGDVVVKLWATPKDRAISKVVNLRVYVRSQPDSSTSYTDRGVATVPVPRTGDFGPVEIRVPVDFTVKKLKRVEIKVVATSDSQEDAWLAWDTTTYPANVVMPVTAGG
jgi:hypothetical protein